MVRVRELGNLENCFIVQTIKEMHRYIYLIACKQPSGVGSSALSRKNTKLEMWNNKIERKSLLSINMALQVCCKLVTIDRQHAHRDKKCVGTWRPARRVHETSVLSITADGTGSMRC